MIQGDDSVADKITSSAVSALGSAFDEKGNPVPPKSPGDLIDDCIKFEKQYVTPHVQPPHVTHSTGNTVPTPSRLVAMALSKRERPVIGDLQMVVNHPQLIAVPIVS